MKGTAYLIQATLIALWWVGMLVSDSFFEAFQFPNISREAFSAFILPDLIVVAGLSVLRAYKNYRWLEFVILGGVAFAALYCINASVLTKGGLLPTVLMGLCLAYNAFLIAEQKMFRVSKSSSTTINFLKTILQIICVWAITLVVFPLVILSAFDLQLPEIAEMNVMGVALLCVFSLLGLYSAYIMVQAGKGTPLPIDQTQRLVTKGPYNYVRNPMAIAGLGQGIGVSLML